MNIEHIKNAIITVCDTLISTAENVKSSVEKGEYDNLIERKIEEITTEMLENEKI